MAGRTVTRSATSRDQASSPTKPGRHVNKPSTKPTSRATRSASRELDEAEASDLPVRRTKRSRAVREGSADSIGSSASVEGRAGRKRKNGRISATVTRDLSMITEGQAEEPTNEGTKATQSPGGMSNLSGTTALTSQSEQKMADLDAGMIVELIPDLLREAFQLLDLLAPPSASPEFVETVIKELQVPGSGRGKRLRLRERTFDSTRENYGGELLIDPTLILRKIFNDQEIARGDFRPDVVLHASNLATFVKELLVAQRDNPNTLTLLQRVEGVFPTSFLSKFEDDPKFGNSSLLEPTFKLALDLRTQLSIAILKAYRDENFDPDELLAALFYDPPAQRNESLTHYEDLVINGQCRKMGGMREEALLLLDGQVLDYQADEILKRVESIHEAFNAESNDFDYVDFDKLHERFPWLDFLKNIVQWCQLRRDEIDKNIEKQGGIDNVTRLLVEKVKESDSQIELYYEAPKETQLTPEVAKARKNLLPAATIIPASAGKSLYNSPRSLLALLRKAAPEFVAPPSNQQHPAAPFHRPAEPQIVGSKFAFVSEEVTDTTRDQLQHKGEMMNFDDDQTSVDEVVSLYYEGETYNHKENRPIDPSENQRVRTLKFIDPQPNAERVMWSQDRDDDDEFPVHVRSKAKRSYQTMAKDNEDDEDDAFETDPREVDQSRRKRATRPVAQSNSQFQRSQPPTKRAHTGASGGDFQDSVATATLQHEEEHAEQEGWQESQEEATQDEGPLQRSLQDEALQSSAQQADEAPPSSYAFVQETAKAAMLKHRAQSGPQQRQRWSIEEADALINFIDKYGCGWSLILQKGQGIFADTRDQVSLKDKARNIKVELLIAGATLPRNFNGVALGKKEKEKVKANHMNPYRLEGELPGEEIYDMDGKLLELE